ncbi:MAG TPA: DedA family protein [Solirubrobacteraceae bacterium]|jgi:membrane protein DedA with SNARE-associated domain|nr:DedA family protein [Solirubrobacteraceae bacterium]
MLIGFASVTDVLVTVATHVIRDLGLAGILIMIGSSGVIGVPGSELPMLFAGFNVYQHHLTLLGVIVFGVLGDTIGASIAYGIGHYGRRELLERHGGKLHLTPARLDGAERWFERRGTISIPLSRMLPLARAAFPYAAGASRVPFARFVVLATLGSIPWIAGLAVLGRAVGSNWESWRHHLEYVDYAAVAIVVLVIAYLVLKRGRSGSDGPTPDAVA